MPDHIFFVNGEHLGMVVGLTESQVKIGFLFSYTDRKTVALENLDFFLFLKSRYVGPNPFPVRIPKLTRKKMK
jgi:hypothetical protein